VILEVGSEIPDRSRRLVEAISANGQASGATIRGRDVAHRLGPVLVNHQGLLPSVTISFNLAPGVSLGQAVEEIRQLERTMICR